MAYWLFKQEPGCYSFADLLKEGATVWDGVSNSLARINLRKVKRGDRIFFYQSGKDKAVVGKMCAHSNAQSDPNSEDPKAVVVQVRPLRTLENPVELARIKGDSKLADWDLVRLPRLSVLPVTESQWRRVEELSREACQ